MTNPKPKESRVPARDYHVHDKELLPRPQRPDRGVGSPRPERWRPRRYRDDRRPGTARTGRLRPDHIPAQPGQRRHHAQGHRTGHAGRCAGLRRYRPTARRNVGIPQGQRLRRHRLSAYGAFWLSFWAYLTFYADGIPAEHHGVAAGWYLIAWAIFTSLMLVAALRTTAVLATLFAVVAVVFVLLASGRFGIGAGADHDGRNPRPGRRRLGLVPVLAGVGASTFGRADPAEPTVVPRVSSARSYLNSRPFLCSAKTLEGHNVP